MRDFREDLTRNQNGVLTAGVSAVFRLRALLLVLAVLCGLSFLRAQDSSLSLTETSSDTLFTADTKPSPVFVTKTEPGSEAPLPERSEKQVSGAETANETEGDGLFTEENSRGELAVQMESGELDSRFRLFEEFDATANWASTIEKEMRGAFDLLEKDPARARIALRRLSGIIVKDDLDEKSLLLPEEAELASHRNDLLRENGFAAALSSEKYSRSAAPNPPDVKTETADDARSTGLQLYSPAERAKILRGFRHSLDRRVYLWAAAADYFEGVSKGTLRAGREITPKEIAELKSMTASVRNYFGVSESGQRWRNNFEVDELYGILDRLERHQKSDGGVFHPYQSGGSAEWNEEAELRQLRDCANSICYKVGSASLTPEQKSVFEKAAAPWYRKLQTLTADQTDPYSLLALYESYEREGGGDLGKELGLAAYRMKTSPSEPSRKLGEALGTIYNNPNLKVYVSQAFLNRFLPIRDPEFDVVQERILGNPVAGSRRTDTQVRVQLVPDSKRLLMNLVVTGRIVASTKSEIFPAKIFNESYANYAGVKRIEWGNSGLLWNDCQVDVSNTNLLSDVRTNIDFVPIVGGLAREMVKGEYQSKQEALREETRQKIAREVTRRIDTESSERFQTMNERLAQNFYAKLDEMGLSLTLQNSQTTKDWLLASLRLSEPGMPGSQTAEPPTLNGAFADLKVHESAVNTFLSRLELAGKSWTPEELVAHLAAKFNRTPAPVDKGDMWVEFGMAQTDPVSVSFTENRVRLRLRFDYIDLGSQSWDGVEAGVTYMAGVDEDGTPCLTRDGIITISGPTNIRAQIPLRGLFSKIFPAEKRIPLRPKFFDDERFAGLETGLFRVSDGWMAISVVEKEGAAPLAAGGDYPRLKALRERLAQRSRALRELQNGPGVQNRFIR